MPVCPCAAPDNGVRLMQGNCDVKTELKYEEAEFAGKRSQFKYRRFVEMNAVRRDCSVVIPPNQLEHKVGMQFDLLRC